MVKSGLPPIHPGEFLSEILEELGLSQAEFSRAIGVSSMRVSQGLYRFRTFEEADGWMTEMMAKTYVRWRSARTSRGRVPPATVPESDSSKS